MTAIALRPDRLRQFLALTKPRVVSLIVFTAVIGMFLAAPTLPPLNAVVFGTLGIALVAGAAAAVNCRVWPDFKSMRKACCEPVRSQEKSRNPLCRAMERV